MLTARIARGRGDKQAIDAVLAEMANEPDPGLPMLVYAPPYPRPPDEDIRNAFDFPVDTVDKSNDVRGLQWVDIGFGIRGDGSVSAPEVLRSSRSTGWAAPLVSMIAGRRYTPSTASSDDSPVHYRIERYTLTANFEVPTTSLIRRRVRGPHYQMIDPTDGSAPPHAAS